MLSTSFITTSLSSHERDTDVFLVIYINPEGNQYCQACSNCRYPAPDKVVGMPLMGHDLADSEVAHYGTDFVIFGRLSLGGREEHFQTGLFLIGEGALEVSVDYFIDLFHFLP